MNSAKAIIDEMTGCASIGTVEVGTPLLVGPSVPKRSVSKAKKKIRPVKESMTGDVAPVLVGMSPRTFSKLRYRVNGHEDEDEDEDHALEKRAAIESILGESSDALIPDDAEELESSGTEDHDEPQGKPEAKSLDLDLDNEDLLQTSLALVAPDTTPGSSSELDPELVPNRDPALDSILGLKKTTQRVEAPEDKPESSQSESIQEDGPSGGLPSDEMPRPPGQFLRPIGQIGEGQEDKGPKVELVVGSNTSVVGSAHTEGELGVSSMPQPKEGNIAKTMDVFRRFSQSHRK